MRAVVDEKACIGSMGCESICPEVFKVVGGIARVQVDCVPPDEEERCRMAAQACPAQAIRLVQD